MKLIKTLQMKLYKGLAIFATRRRDYWRWRSGVYGNKYVSTFQVDLDEWKLELYNSNPFN